MRLLFEGGHSFKVWQEGATTRAATIRGRRLIGKFLPQCMLEIVLDQLRANSLPLGCAQVDTIYSPIKLMKQMAKRKTMENDEMMRPSLEFCQSSSHVSE